jgi:hypothetical protein
MAGPADPPQHAARTGAGRHRDRRGGRACGAGHRHSAGAAGDCRRGRQGLRGDRRGLPDAGNRLPVLRHDGHHQHHHAPLCRGDPLRAALPLGGAGPLQHRNPDHARLLDGELVQGAVRPVRAATGAAARRGAGDAVRRAGERGTAGLTRLDAAAVLEPRHQGARPRGQGRHHRLWRRAQPRAPVPRDPGGAGLRAARGPRAHRAP